MQSGQEQGQEQERTEYLTHDNGGSPFRVIVNTINEITKSVTVLKNNDDDDEDDEDDEDDDDCDEDDTKNFKIVLGYNSNSKISGDFLVENPFQIFIGESPENAMTIFSGGHGDEFDGNTILIRPTEDLEYIFVGNTVKKFRADSEILHFISPVGNNDVPCAYAISSNNMYLFSEEIVVTTNRMPKELLDSFIDGSDEPYTYLYGNENKAFPDDTKEERFETEEIMGSMWD